MMFALEFHNYSSVEFFMVIIPSLTLNFILQLVNFTNYFISPPPCLFFFCLGILENKHF